MNKTSKAEMGEGNAPCTTYVTDPNIDPHCLLGCEDCGHPYVGHLKAEGNAPRVRPYENITLAILGAACRALRDSSNKIEAHRGESAYDALFVLDQARNLINDSMLKIQLRDAIAKAEGSDS